MLAVILFSFILFHAIPSDPARIILGPNADEKQVTALSKELGLDKPLHIQLIDYLKKILILDFGRSFIDERPVFYEVARRLGISLYLVIFCILFIISYTLIVIQTFSFNKMFKKINFLFISVPTFFSAIIIALISIRYLPSYTFSGAFNSMDDYLFFLPPAFVLALYPMAIISRILIEEMETILNSQYILTARSFALPKLIIMYKYAFRNALIPCMATFSNQLPTLFTGAFIVEIIFSIPGIGILLIKKIWVN